MFRNRLIFNQFRNRNKTTYSNHLSIKDSILVRDTEAIRENYRMINSLTTEYNMKYRDNIFNDTNHNLIEIKCNIKGIYCSMK